MLQMFSSLDTFSYTWTVKIWYLVRQNCICRYHLEMTRLNFDTDLIHGKDSTRAKLACAFIREGRHSLSPLSITVT